MFHTEYCPRCGRYVKPINQCDCEEKLIVSLDNYKIGIFLKNEKMAEFDLKDYSLALVELVDIYEETKIPHELKIIKIDE